MFQLLAMVLFLCWGEARCPDRAISAGSAEFAVGYDSRSQFSREYRRLFGAPPRTDIAGAA